MHSQVAYSRQSHHLSFHRRSNCTQETACVACPYHERNRVRGRYVDSGVRGVDVRDSHASVREREVVRPGRSLHHHVIAQVQIGHCRPPQPDSAEPPDDDQVLNVSRTQRLTKYLGCLRGVAQLIQRNQRGCRPGRTTRHRSYAEAPDARFRIEHRCRGRRMSYEEFPVVH